MTDKEYPTGTEATYEQGWKNGYTKGRQDAVAIHGTRTMPKPMTDEQYKDFLSWLRGAGARKEILEQLEADGGRMAVPDLSHVGAELHAKWAAEEVAAVGTRAYARGWRIALEAVRAWSDAQTTMDACKMTNDLEELLVRLQEGPSLVAERLEVPDLAQVSTHLHAKWAAEDQSHSVPDVEEVRPPVPTYEDVQDAHEQGLRLGIQRERARAVGSLRELITCPTDELRDRLTMLVATIEASP